MRTSLRVIAVLVAAAMPLAAQGPGGMNAPAPGPTPPAARFLLAHTGELNLSDAQVVKLAAIERRAEARRVAVRASMDSMRTRFMAQGVPADSAARVGRRTAAMAMMEGNRTRMREGEQADLKDAIAVLTNDQQAKVWQLMAQAGRGARGMGPGRGMGARAGQPRPFMRPGRPGMGMGQPPAQRPPV